MNTPAHLILAAAAFARPGHRLRNAAALAGGLVPDLSLYAMTSWAILVNDTSPRVVFDQLYFSPEWTQVFAIDNSVFVWSAVLVLGLLLRAPVLMVFAAAALLHIAFDFPLHHDDGRPHFWPMSMWIFESPLSYWDWRHHGRIVGALETAVCVILLVVLWRRFSGGFARAAVAVAFLALAGPILLFSALL